MRPAKRLEEKYDKQIKSYVKEDTIQILDQISSDKGYSRATVIRKLVEIGIESYLHGRSSIGKFILK